MIWHRDDIIIWHREDNLYLKKWHKDSAREIFQPVKELDALEEG